MVTPMPLPVRLQENQGRRCAAPSCPNQRHRVGAFCRPHGRLRHLYGHPLGRSIRPMEHSVETELVEKFIEAHREHPAVKAACVWIEDWMVRSWKQDSSLPAYRAMQRLYDQRVDPMAILKAALAVWLFSAWHPRKLPDDLRLTYAISLAVLRHVPRERMTNRRDPSRSYRKHWSGEERIGIGTRIRTNLVPLFINLKDSLEREEEKNRKHYFEIRTPFGQPPTTGVHDPHTAVAAHHQHTE
jgi:hypothetical protein